MASDTQLTNGSEYQNHFSKVGRTKDYLFGYVGVLGGIYPMYDFLLDVESMNIDPTNFYRYADRCAGNDDDGAALIANKAGDVWILSANGFVTPQPRKYAAIGSGGEFALGSLVYGSGAYEAVNVAMLCDTGTSGSVVYTTFATEKLTRPDVILIDTPA